MFQGWLTDGKKRSVYTVSRETSEPMNSLKAVTRPYRGAFPGDRSKIGLSTKKLI